MHFSDHDIDESCSGITAGSREKSVIDFSNSSTSSRSVSQQPQQQQQQQQYYQQELADEDGDHHDQEVSSRRRQQEGKNTDRHHPDVLSSSLEMKQNDRVLRWGHEEWCWC
jgi:hypothetical protein